MTVVEACCLPSVEVSVGCPYQKVAMVSMKPLFFRNLSQRAHNKRWHYRKFKLECFSSFVFSPTISETFGTSAEILSAMSWQRLCPLVQRSWQPASPRCCCNPWHGTCSPTSWRRQISSEKSEFTAWSELADKQRFTFKDSPRSEQSQSICKPVVQKELQGTGAILQSTL